MLVLALCVSTTVMADDRNVVKDAIRRWGECKNVAITKTGGDAAIYGKNGYQTQNTPTAFTNALSELNDADNTIKEIQITENGSWLVVYNENGYRTSGLPNDMLETMSDYNDQHEEITGCSVNDRGEWAVITTEHFSTSSTSLTNWLKQGVEDHGQLWTICITNDGIVAVFENGYKYQGNVPESMKEALRETDKDIYYAKFAGTSWFIADKWGWYRYNM